MDFPDGSTRQKLPLLFVGERLLDTLLIQPARCPAQRGVKLFEVIRLNLLNLLLAEIGHDKILDHGYRVGVGLGCPLVLAGLDGEPLVQHFRYRHCIGYEERTVQEFFLYRDLAVLRFLLGFETLPAFTDPASMVFVFETNGVGISAPENRCHRCSLPQTAANQSSKLCLLTRMLVPRRITLKSFVVLHRLYAARLEIANSWAISSTR